MKITFSALITLVAITINAQDVKTDSALRKTKSKIHIGINFSPDHCYRSLKTKDATQRTMNIINGRNSEEIWCIGFTAGMNLSYSFNKMYAFETGLQMANIRYQTNSFPLVWGAPPFNELSTALYVYNHYYAEIPLKLVTTFGYKKFKLNIGFGIAPSFLLHYTNTFDVFDSNDKLTQSKTKVYSGYNKVNLFLLADIGFSYKLNNRSAISLEPTYRYGMIKIKNATVQEYLWNMGINVGYNFQL